MAKHLSTKSLNNRAARRRNLKRKQGAQALHGSLVDLQPSRPRRLGWTLALFVVGLTTVASVVLFIGGGAA